MHQIAGNGKEIFLRVALYSSIGRHIFIFSNSSHPTNFGPDFSSTEGNQKQFFMVGFVKYSGMIQMCDLEVNKSILG